MFELLSVDKEISIEAIQSLIDRLEDLPHEETMKTILREIMQILLGSQIESEVWTVKIAEGLVESSMNLLFNENDPISPNEVIYLMRLVHESKVKEVIRHKTVKYALIEDF